MMELRDPQPRSIAEVLRIWEHGALVGTGTARGALLADSMGLGKTATAVIAARRAKMRRVLVICPKSAIPDWRREIDLWHPMPGVVRTFPQQPWTDFDNGWMLINYDMLARFAEELRSRAWDLLVLDEAHATKEPERRRTILIHGGVWNGKAYSPIRSKKALVISGTPIKNRMEELFNALNLLDPTSWPDRDLFIDEYYEGCSNSGSPRSVINDRVVQNVATRNLLSLHEKLRKTVLVRTNKDDIPGLPSKRFEKFMVPLEEVKQRAWFDQEAFRVTQLSRMLQEARKLGDEARARELVERIRQKTSKIRQNAAMMKGRAVLDYLLKLPHKAVVICFHRGILLDQLERALRDRGRGVVVHTGDNSQHAESTVRKFQKRADVQFFLGQLSVSNLSLTLTAADHVVFAEIPESYADFAQALDRVHRFRPKGEEVKEVTATAFVLDWDSAGDKSLLEMLREWKGLSDVVLDGRESGASWEWHVPREPQGT
jgi:SNF2 family DNA or RNA helicase